MATSSPCPVYLTSPRVQLVPANTEIIVSGASFHKYDAKELDNIIAKLDVGSKVDEANLETFYMVANRHHISGTEVLICPLCTRKLVPNADKCSDKLMQIRSHIFPKSLLKQYCKIHCGKENTNFIWDLSSKKPIQGAPSLKFLLFCRGCEDKAVDEESYLRNVYLKIMGSALVRVTEEESHKLRHILAVILFRGALLGINFETFKTKYFFRDFYKLFIELRDYCCEESIEKYKILPIAKNLNIFLLHNTSFSRSNIGLITTLDFQLRNPKFTCLVEKDGVFLYTKFDCFHVELPIIYNDTSPLKKTGCFSDQYKVAGYFYLPPPTAAVDLFPDKLLQFNLSLIGNLADQLTRIPNVGCVIQMFENELVHPQKEYSRKADANKMVIEEDNYDLYDDMKNTLKMKWNLSEEQVSQVLNIFVEFGTIDVSTFIKGYIKREEHTDSEEDLIKKARKQTPFIVEIDQVQEWYDHLWLKLFMVLVCYCCLAFNIVFVLWHIVVLWIVLCTYMYHVYSPLCREHDWKNDLKRNWNLNEEQFDHILRMFNDYDLYIKEATVHGTNDSHMKRAQKQSPFVKSDRVWREEMRAIKAVSEKQKWEDNKFRKNNVREKERLQNKNMRLQVEIQKLQEKYDTIQMELQELERRPLVNPVEETHGPPIFESCISSPLAPIN